MNIYILTYLSIGLLVAFLHVVILEVIKKSNSFYSDNDIKYLKIILVSFVWPILIFWLLFMFLVECTVLTLTKNKGAKK